MATLTNKIIQYIGAEVDFINDVKLQNDGQGDYIKEWNLDIPQPTQAQLDALETQANEYEENLITNRENKKASAKQKLQDLGLTVDEIKEAFGI
jgi:hypothetical protein